MLLMAAMGEIQPGHVHAGQAHLGQGFFVFTGGADGADDLRFSHNNLPNLLCFLIFVYGAILPHFTLSVNQIGVKFLPGNAAATHPAARNRP